MDSLTKLHVIILNACPLCLANGEYIYLYSPSSAKLKGYSSALVSFWVVWSQLGFPSNICLLFEAWRLGVSRGGGRIMWQTSFLAVIWTIWKEKNARCFVDESPSGSGRESQTPYSFIVVLSSTVKSSLLLFSTIIRNWQEIALFFMEAHQHSHVASSPI